MFDEFERELHFRRLWNSVRIERPVKYSLFTFGDSKLAYYLVTPKAENEDLVRIQQGQVTISRARIITPDSLRPEFRNFFEDNEDFGLADFLMTRTAAFSNLKLDNHFSSERIATDSLAEAIDRLNR